MLTSASMTSSYCSVRMLSRRDGQHHSGAERLVDPSQVEEVVHALLRRAMTHVRGTAQEVRIQVEEVDSASLQTGALPALTTRGMTSVDAARAEAVRLLQRAGVAAAVARQAVTSLATGAAAPGRTMRGAMLVDAQTGARREPDRQRGVRVSRLDLAAALEPALLASLSASGLNRPQVREALVLAAKVLAAPGVVAELCWSDDPDYTTGYVAAPSLGYVRLEPVKTVGDPLGGRVFFLAPGTALAPLIEYLERTPFLADRLAPGMLPL